MTTASLIVLIVASLIAIVVGVAVWTHGRNWQAVTHQERQEMEKAQAELDRQLKEAGNEPNK